MRSYSHARVDRKHFQSLDVSRQSLFARCGNSARLLVASVIAYTVRVNIATSLFPKKGRSENLSLRHLFPDLTEEKLHDVENFFYGYLEIVWDIYREAKRRDPHRFDKTRDPSKI